MNIHFIKKILVIILLLIASNAYSAVPSRLINDVTIKKEKGLYVILVKLSVPMHYTHHFPRTESRTVIINLRAFNNISKVVLTSSDKEKYRIPRKRSKLVSYLRVESLDNNVGKIAVQFKKKLKFSVKQINKKTLKIIIGKSNASSKLAKSKKKLKRKSKSKKKVSLSKKRVIKKNKSRRKTTKRKTKITYVLNLESYQKGKKPRKIPKLDVFKKYKLFRTRVKRKNTLITRLRLGFFRSKTEAKRVKRKLKVYYPNTFVTLIQKNEGNLSRKWFAKNKVTPRKKRKVASKRRTKKLTKKQVGKVDKLFAKGKLAMIEKKYRNAISFFTKVTEIGSGLKKQQALEFIGLAREKNGQIAHAKAEYKDYLKVYPDGIGHERVKQRLEGLLTAQLAPKKSKGKKKNKKDEQEWEYFSTVSQNYRNQVSQRQGLSSSTTDNSISSYYNTSGRKRGDEFDMKFQFDIDHRYDFTENARRVSDLGLSSAYFDFISLTGLGAARFGRQSRSSGGVLGRFDGIWYGYPYSNDIKINLVTGLPVRSGGGINVNINQIIYGASVDFDKIFKKIDLTTFIVQQTFDGTLDRRAVGAEVRYFDNQSQYFGIVDYDISFAKLNYIQFNANWFFKDNKSINIVYDRRSAPIITTSNALIGQGLSRLSELRALVSDSEIRKLALARSVTYESLSISGNLPLNNTYSVSADMSLNKSGKAPRTVTPENGNQIVEKVDAVGPDYYFGGTLVGSNLFSKRDTNIFSLRQSIGTTQSTVIDVRSQFNLNKKWRLRPRVRYDIRTRKSNTSKTNRISTSARLDYRYTRELQFQFELTAEFTKTTDVGVSNNDTDYSIDLSYIYDF